MKRWAGLIVALTACVEIPQYESNSNVSWKDSAGGGTMTSGTAMVGAAPFVQLTLAGGDGLHFPSDLKFLGTSILGHTQNVSCGFEDRGGIAVYPGPRMSPDSTITGINANQIMPTLLGPAAVTVVFQWGAEFSCDGHNHDPGGYSIFTMFPDGQIARYDEINESDLFSANWMTCDCGTQPSAGAWIISTFWTFDHQQFDNVFGTNTVPDGVSQTIPNSTGIIGLGHNYACIDKDGASTSVDVAWIGNNAAQVPYDRIVGPGTNNDNSTFALVHDFDRPQDIMTLSPTEHRGMTLLTFHPERACETTADGASLDFIAQHGVTVDGQLAQMGNDGIYGGYILGQDMTGVQVGDRSFTIQGPTSAGFAVWMRFAFDVESLHITKGDGQAGTWFVPQQIDSRQWIVWFRDSLPTGQTIQIETE